MSLFDPKYLVSTSRVKGRRERPSTPVHWFQSGQGPERNGKETRRGEGGGVGRCDGGVWDCWESRDQFTVRESYLR